MKSSTKTHDNHQKLDLDEKLFRTSAIAPSQGVLPWKLATKIAEGESKKNPNYSVPDVSRARLHIIAAIRKWLLLLLRILLPS